MILSTGGVVADDGHVVSFLQNARARQIDLTPLLVAEQGGRVVWCALPIVFPGRTAIYLCAQVHTAQVEAARAVVEQLLVEHQGQGLRLAQVLLDPGDNDGHGFFESCGFHRLAELVYLETRSRELPVVLPAGFSLINYSEKTHALFARAISASYEQTLDCPGLEGVRDIEEVIAGHKAAGVFHEKYWFAVMQRETPVGALLLAPVPPSDALELVYVGLAMGARGRGLSEPLMRLALSTAKAAGCHRLTTAVDAQNTPAMRMYVRHGMQRVGSRVAMMRVLCPARTEHAPDHPPVIPTGVVKRG